jgi:hypothetical protein
MIGAMFSDREQAAAAAGLLERAKFREIWLGVLVSVDENTSFGEFNWLCFAGVDELWSTVLRAKGLTESQITAIAGDLREGNALVTVPAIRRAAEAGGLLRNAGGRVYES